MVVKHLVLHLPGNLTLRAASIFTRFLARVAAYKHRTLFPR